MHAGFGKQFDVEGGFLCSQGDYCCGAPQKSNDEEAGASVSGGSECYLAGRVGDELGGEVV